MSKPFLDRRWPWIAAGAVIVAVFAYSSFDVRFDREADPRPQGSAEDIARLRDRSDVNVLFILIDTLRAERLGAYGYERDTSPELDRLAATGARFAHQLSQSSWTKASMASLWTQMNPTHAGITRYDHVIPADARMPAEVLREAGFRTVGIYRNGWVSPNFGFGQGFDVYVRPAPRPLPPAVRLANPTIKQRGTDEDAIAAAVEFLRVRSGERWFLYLHLMDVHEYLYDEESALFGGTYSDIYDNAIRWVDGTIAVLMEHLADLGLASKTLVVVASDHGEAFRERGIEGHARAVYRETTEVPFLLSFPFRLAEGIVVPGRTRNVDVWPTVFDLIGIEPPSGVDGRSAVPELLAAGRGEPPPDGDRTAFSHLDQNWGQAHRAPKPIVAVVEGPLRYVRSLRGSAPVEQLFDAARDPRELDDRAQEEPEALDRLRAAADAALEVAPAWGEAPTREIDELELNQLRALGYAIP